MRNHDALSTRPQVPFDDDRVNPELFKQHVGADLVAVVAGYACFVRLDMCSYGEALNSCMGYAWRRGAWGFNPHHLSELQDWLHDALTMAIGPEAV